MLYALTESSLISSLPVPFRPHFFSATPHLLYSLWIALCLLRLPPMCQRIEDFKDVDFGGENILINQNEVHFHLCWHSMWLSVPLWLVCSFSNLFIRCVCSGLLANFLICKESVCHSWYEKSVHLSEIIVGYIRIDYCSKQIIKSNSLT